MADSILAQIESGAVARLQDKWPADVDTIAEFDINSRVDNIVCPGIHAAAEISKIDRVAADLWKFTIALRLYVIFKSLRGAEDRRQGAHPIVEAIIALMAGQDLGLDIGPIQPLRAPEITDADLRAQSKIAFRIDCSTTAEVEKMSEEDAVALLEIAADYLYKPGDDEADGSTLTDLS